MSFANPNEQLSVTEPQDSDINILLLGETGVGKSTFINSFVNYLQHTTLKNAMNSELECLIPLKFIIPNEDFKEEVIEFGSDQNEDTEIGNSSTQGAKAYLFPFEDYNIRLIDTPGIGDARGINQDEQNFENVLTYISQYKHLHGICFLLKPNVSVIHAYFKFCIVHLLSRLEKSAVNNIIFIFTNGRNTFYRPGETLPLLKRILNEIKESPPYVEVPCSKKNMFCLDNEAFKFLIAKKHGVKFEDDETREFAMSWKTSYKTCKDILSYIRGDKNNDPLLPHDIRNTLSVNEARRVIKDLSKPLADISEYILDNLKVLENQVTYLQQQDLTKNQLIKQLYIPSIEFELTTLAEPMTVCTSPKCSEIYTCGELKKYQYKQICHKPCFLSKVPQEIIGTPELKHCLAMKESTCTKCECDYSVHMHVNYGFKIIEKMQENVSVQKKIKSRQEAIKASTVMVGKLKKNIADFEAERESISKCVAKFTHFLKENSISTYNDTYLDYFNYLIKRENLLGDQKDEARVKHYTSLKTQYEQEKKKLNDLSANSEVVVTVSDIPDLIQLLYNLPLTGSKISKLHFVQQHSIQKSVHTQEYRFPTLLKFASESSLFDEDEEIPTIKLTQSSVATTEIEQRKLKLTDEQFNSKKGAVKRMVTLTTDKSIQEKSIPKQTLPAINDDKLKVSDSKDVEQRELKLREEQLYNKKGAVKRMVTLTTDKLTQEKSIPKQTFPAINNDELKVSDSYMIVSEEEIPKYNKFYMVPEDDVSNKDEVNVTELYMNVIKKNVDLKFTKLYMDVCEEEVLKDDEVNMPESFMNVFEKEGPRDFDLVSDLLMDFSEEEALKDGESKETKSYMHVSKAEASKDNEGKVTELHINIYNEGVTKNDALKVELPKDDEVKVTKTYMRVSENNVELKTTKLEMDVCEVEDEKIMTKCSTNVIEKEVPRNVDLKLTESYMDFSDEEVSKDVELKLTESYINVTKEEVLKDIDKFMTECCMNVQRDVDLEVMDFSEEEVSNDDELKVTKSYMHASNEKVSKDNDVNVTESLTNVYEKEVTEDNESPVNATEVEVPKSNEVIGTELYIHVSEKGDDLKVTKSYALVSKKTISQVNEENVPESPKSICEGEVTKDDQLKMNVFEEEVPNSDKENPTKSYMCVPEKEELKVTESHINASKRKVSKDDKSNVTQQYMNVYKEEASSDDDALKVPESCMKVSEKESSMVVKVNEENVPESDMSICEGEVTKNDELKIIVSEEEVLNSDKVNPTKSYMCVPEKEELKDAELNVTEFHINASKKKVLNEDESNVTQQYMNVDKEEASSEDALKVPESCMKVSEKEGSTVVKEAENRDAFLDWLCALAPFIYIILSILFVYLICFIFSAP